MMDGIWQGWSLSIAILGWMFAVMLISGCICLFLGAVIEFTPLLRKFFLIRLLRHEQKKAKDKGTPTSGEKEEQITEDATET